MVIGRELGADLVLAWPQVSARHAWLGPVSNGAYLLRDLGSTNGTWVNGRQVDQATVTTVDEVRLGSVVLDWSAVLERLAEGPDRAASGFPALIGETSTLRSETSLAVLRRSTAREMLSTPSSALAHYELLGPIGEGGMGSVARALDLRFHRTVAVKVLHRHFARDPDVVARFAAEARIQAALLHPAITRVYELVVEADILAMVMELVEGDSLEQLLESRGRLSPRETTEIFRQVLLGLDYAHSQGVVHRDVKPSNILLLAHERSWSAKLVDFGIAKVLGVEKSRTAAGAKMGTLAYMAPEQIRSPRDVCASADIYAAGAAMFEALAGRIPFDADSEYDLIRQVLDSPVPSLRAVAPGTPDHIARAVARALEKDPAHRFPTASSFAAALSGAREVLLPAVSGGPLLEVAARLPGASIELASEDIDRELLERIEARDATGVREALARGANPEACDAVGTRALVLAARRLNGTGDSGTIFALLREAGARMSPRVRISRWNQAPLWVAWLGSVAVGVRLMVEYREVALAPEAAARNTVGLLLLVCGVAVALRLAVVGMARAASDDQEQQPDSAAPSP